ncbi:MAG: lysylphosphatidylglycerol synthase transmembrane domain-containing protein [Alphaproteobacteria bacterium]|nr:lysylphosphatidylglycerol synthase transmembrane domain-containing protein [Alphaproteobacteria bacterium]
MNKAFIFFLAKIAIIAIIAYFLLNNLNIDHVRQALKNVSWQTICFCFVLFWTQGFLMSKRWQKIVSAKYDAPPIQTMWRLNLISFFVNQVFPGSIGGDVYRGIILKKFNIPTYWAVTTVLMERFYGITGFCILVFLCLPFEWQTMNQTYLGSIVVLSMGGVAGLIAVILTISRLPFKLPKQADYIINFSNDLWDIIHQTKNNAQILAYSTLSTIVYALAPYLLALDMGLNITYPQLLVAMIISSIVETIPVSFAGWGVREGALVAIFATYGISKEHSLSLSLMHGVIFLLATTPGLFLWIFEKKDLIMGKQAD